MREEIDRTRPEPNQSANSGGSGGVGFLLAVCLLIALLQDCGIQVL